MTAVWWVPAASLWLTGSEVFRQRNRGSKRDMPDASHSDPDAPRRIGRLRNGAVLIHSHVVWSKWRCHLSAHAHAWHLNLAFLVRPHCGSLQKELHPHGILLLGGWLPMPLCPGSSCKGEIAISSQCAWEWSWEGVVWIQPPATCCTERMGRSLPRELCNFALQMLAHWHRARGGE